MAQIRYHTYQRPLDSFAENRRTLGNLQAGRYRGFDTFNQSGALAGALLHTATGVVKTDILLASSNPMGSLITPQGVMIYENTPVNISGFVTNVGVNQRLDLIVCEHEYLDSIGGQAATYSVIKGTSASSQYDIPVAPALTNPEKQVIIGTMFIPAGAVNLSNAVYSPGVPTKTNGQGLALLDQTQKFTKTQSWSKGTDTEVVAANGAIELQGDGNLFTVVMNSTQANYISEKPIGTIIQLALKNGTNSQCTFVNFAGLAPVGYKNMNPSSGNRTFIQGDTLTFQRQDAPSNTWELLCTSNSLGDIITNADDIADNANDIAANDTAIGVNNGLIVANLATIVTHTGSISANQNNIILLLAFKTATENSWTYFGTPLSTEGAVGIAAATTSGSRYRISGKTIFIHVQILVTVTTAAVGSYIKFQIPGGITPINGSSGTAQGSCCWTEPGTGIHYGNGQWRTNSATYIQFSTGEAEGSANNREFITGQYSFNFQVMMEI